LYDTIVEPFAGAAGYSCFWYRKNVVLYEINPVIYGILDYLIKATPEMIMALPMLRGDEKIDDLKISKQEKDLLGMWSYPGCTTPCKTKSKWCREYPKYSSNWGPNCRRRLAVTVTKIKHWQVFNADYRTIDVNSIGPATWYVDPPYQLAGKSYKFGPKQIDYPALGEWCKSLPGQVIVCENTGATWLPFRPLCKLKGLGKCGGRNGGQSTEAIWTKNCDLYPTLFKR
jgi:site-specific DNA-adenine methylase